MRFAGRILPACTALGLPKLWDQLVTRSRAPGSKKAEVWLLCTDAGDFWKLSRLEKSAFSLVRKLGLM
jgi:hypothetical protein